MHQLFRVMPVNDRRYPDKGGACRPGIAACQTIGAACERLLDVAVQREVEALFGEWLGDACGGDWLASLLAREYLHVVRFWVADDSEDGERTTALVDKIAAFVGEVSRSSELVYKGVDLAKYLVANDIVKVPFGKNALAQILRWAR